MIERKINNHQMRLLIGASALTIGAVGFLLSLLLLTVGVAPDMPLLAASFLLSIVAVPFLAHHHERHLFWRNELELVPAIEIGDELPQPDIQISSEPLESTPESVEIEPAQA